MKKVVLLSLMALMLCVFPTNMRADDVCHTIGSATEAVDMPKSTSQSSSFQMIFTKGELLAAGVRPGAIGGITFNWSVTNAASKELYIYMASTSKSVFANSGDYELASTFTTARGYCYVSSTYNTSSGENTYTFNSPFIWDGYSNIVIATIVNGNPGSKSNIGFTSLGSNCSENRCIYENSTRQADRFSVGNFNYPLTTDQRPVITFCQDTTPCPKVTGLTVSNVSYTSATISWDACASCTNGYDVVCSSSPVTDFSAATIQHVSTNSVSLTGLSIHTGYYVYVRSCCGIYSDWSEALQFKTLSDCGDPGNVAITDIGKHQMTLNWNTSPKATSYDIIVSLAELADPSSAEVAYANVTGSSKVLGNLRCEITYHVYIRANCGTNGYSDWTHVSATTLPVRRYDCSRDADYVCGTGTATSDLVHPARPCSYIQEIYTADELHALGFAAGPIKAVEFDFQSFGYNENNHKMQSVYIGTTDKDTFAESASEFVTGLTQVYGPVERTCPNNGGWLRYDFSTSFYWDGESNIVVCFRSDKCGDDEITAGWHANGTLQKDSNNQSIYRTINASDYNPIDTNRINSVNNIYRNYRRSNIRFVICYPDTDPCPTIRNAPDASSITHDAATITWSVISEEDVSSYDIIVSENEIDDIETWHDASQQSNATSYRLTGLNQETDYYVYVRVNCVNGDLSESSYQWSPVCHFRTDELCKTPYNLSVTNIAERTATLSWNVRDNSATAFDLVVSKVPLTDPSAGTVHDITATNNAGACNYALDHLAHDTHYYLYIRTDCGGDASSHWSPVEFNTMSILDCNSTQTVVVAEGTVENEEFPVNGYRCDYSQKSQSIYSASMLTGLLGNKITRLKYFVKSGGSSSSNKNWENATFKIRMMTTNETNLSSGFVFTADATEVYSGTLRANVQNGMEITLTEPFVYTGGNLLIEFELPVRSDFSSCSFCGIEADGNVSRLQYSISSVLSTFLPKVEFTTCEKTPACPALSAAPVASDVTYNSATITWNAGAGEYVSTYDIIVSENEMTEGETQHDASLQTDDTFYNLTGLNPETHYYVYVRVNCNADGYDDGSSLWAPACEFTTEPFCAAPENFAVAGKTSTSARLTWTKRGAAESWKIHVEQDNEITVTGNDCQITGKQVSYTLTGLTPNTNYNLRLQSINDICTGDFYANDFSFRTLNTVTDITSFEITNVTVAADIDATNHTISVTTRYGTDLSNHAFMLTLADRNGIAKVGEQVFTGSWDFTNPVAIQVYAEDRNITPQDWTITVVNETCATPYNLSVTNVDEHNATLNWNVSDNNVTAFDLIMSKVPLNDPSSAGTVRNIVATGTDGVRTYAFDHLTIDTHYYVYIRTNCGNENSHWSFFEFSTMSVFDCSSTQPVVVAEGTVGNEKFPVYGQFCDFSQKSQSIYPASMLRGLLGNKISKLKYFVQSEGSSYYNVNWENAIFNIRMMTTNETNLSSGFVPTVDVTPVYSGTLTANTTDGMVIELTTSFEYSGGNLLIEFELPVATDWSRCFFRGIEADGNVSCLQYIDSYTELSDFLPKVEFTTCEKVSACPEVTNVAATNVDETSATITWTASTGMYANTLDIYYSTTEVEDFTGIEPQVTGITGTSRQITGLAQNTTYYVYVRTHCDAQGYDDGISGWADGTSFLTLAPCRIPGSLTPTVTGKHTATVAWTNTSGGSQADNFTYILNTTPIAEDALETTATTATGVNATSVDLTNLQSETTYYFYLKNVCTDVNCSSPWVSCQFTMPAEMPAVINLQAHDIAHNAFTATWESDTASFANETEWEVACVEHGTQPNTWTQVSVPEYFIFGLNEKTTYDFYVRAKNGNNHSANAMIEVTTIGECQIIGESTEVDPDYSPIGSMFGFERHIYLFTQDDGLDGDRIRSISWQYQTGNTTVPVKIYLKNTTLTDLTSLCNGSFNAAIDGATLVYDGSVTLSDGWIDIDIDEFEYAGGNIMVFVASNYGGYGSLCEQKACITNGVQPNTHIGFSNSYSIPDDDPMSSFRRYRLNNRRHNIKFCFDWGSCSSVGKLKVDDITTTTARAHWYPGDTETAWHVYNSTTELTNDGLAALTTSNYIEVTANPECNLTGLNPDKDYYFYVRAVCGDDEVSHWNCCHYTTSLTCSAPVSPTATSGADNSVTFTVNPGEYGDEGTYDYRYWIAGSNDIVTESGKTSPFTVSGLSGDKDYEWEVRANCSGTGEGSSRWVKGNTVHVCGTTILPYFNDFNQYELPFSAIDCWTVTKVDPNKNKPYPLALYGDMCFLGNSAIATPLINVPDEGLKISLRIEIVDQQELKVMFTTDLAANESTYTEIATLINDGTNGFSDRVMFFNPEEATQGYIVFSGMIYGDSYCFVDSLLIEAMPTGGIKDVTVDNVTYTISGLQQGNDVTIEKVTFDENDLTEADFDITYGVDGNHASNYVNYKHKLDIPATLTDVIKDRYKVVAIKLDAFDDDTLNYNVRVNIPSGVTVINEGDMQKEEIVMRFNGYDSLLYGGNKYFSSKAYMVNIHGDGATLTQRPFGDNRPLQITYTDGDGTTVTNIDNANVFMTEGDMQFKYEEGAWWNVNRESESGMFEAWLIGDEVTIDVGRINTIRVAEDAQYNGTFDLTFCDELKFQSDNVNRSYPDCQLTENMALGDGTKVKAEMKFNNREYYYFSLPFDCKLEDINVMAGMDEVERSNSIDEAINSEDLATHHYVLFKWDESAYTSDKTTGYVAYSGTMLEKNKGYVIAIVESVEWYDNYWNVDGASLNVTATFTASDDYKQIASSESEVEIPVTRADAANAFSGWNLVGNPFYNQVKSSQYSFNKYVRKVVSDDGIEPKVEDYAPDIPVLNAEIKPFETVFIQKSDAAGPGTVTVTGTSPVQKIHGAPAMLPEYVTITLNDSSRMMDRTTIISNVLSSDDYLQEEDLLKSHQGSNEIYTEYGDFDFSFNEMNITDADKTIPLAVKVAAEGDYTIAMSSELSNYPAGYVFLHDKTLETYMKVSDGEVETLHLTEGVTEDRLELIIKVEEVIVEPDNTEDVSEGGIAVYVHHGIATIEGIEVGAMVTIVDATGKTLYMSEATGNRMDYQFTVRGVYMITVRNNTNVNTVKVVY